MYGKQVLVSCMVKLEVQSIYYLAVTSRVNPQKHSVTGFVDHIMLKYILERR